MLHDRLKGNLDLLLLAVLEDGPAHGYGVITALRDRSDGRFDLAEGTVYPALHRLEHAGLLSSRWETIAGRRRRVYQINPQGATALVGERTQWQRFALSMHAVVGSPA
jgi:DNA-binding PadR family transcriptional regulator